MFRSLFAPSLVVLSVLAVPACSKDDETSLTPPDGTTCGKVVSAKDEASLRNGVAQVGSGGCVVVSGTITSSLPITLGAGVTLAGAKGARATLRSTVAAGSGAALTLSGNGARVANLDIVAPADGTGISIVAPEARLVDVTVSGTTKAAMTVYASEGGSAPSATLQNVSLEKSAVGLYVDGAGTIVEMSGGRVAENGGTSLSAGAGIVVANGAKLTLDGVTVEKNEGTGVLLDGATTRAVIKTSTVAENGQRGIWAQGLKGTLDAPALEIQDTQIAKNRIIGVGGIELKGIIIVGGSVKETVASPIPTDLGKTEPIGDGLGILDGSTDFKIEGTNFERNERAAGLVNRAVVGIIIVGGKVEPGDSGLKFVVQNSGEADVQIAAADRSTPAVPLAVNAQKLSIPKL
jgi:hypothetical protein